MCLNVASLAPLTPREVEFAGDFVKKIAELKATHENIISGFGNFEGKIKEPKIQGELNQVLEEAKKMFDEAFGQYGLSPKGIEIITDALKNKIEMHDQLSEVKKIAKEIFDEAVKQYGLSREKIGTITDVCMTQMFFLMKNKNCAKPIDALSIMQKTIEQALKDLPAYIEESAKLTPEYYDSILQNVQDYVPKIEEILRLCIENNIKTIEKLDEKANADNKQLIQDLMRQNMFLNMCFSQSPESQELKEANERITELEKQLKNHSLRDYHKVQKIAEDNLKELYEIKKIYEISLEKVEKLEAKDRKLSESLRQANEAKKAVEKTVENQRIKYEADLKLKEKEIKKLTQLIAENKKEKLKLKEENDKNQKQLIADSENEKLDRDRKIEELTKTKDGLFDKFTEENEKTKKLESELKILKLESVKSSNGINSMQWQYDQLSRKHDGLLKEFTKLKGILASQRTDEQLQQRRAAEIINLCNELKKAKEENEKLTGQLKASQQLLDQALNSQVTSSSSSSGAMTSNSL
jgi:hypothetical protein